MSAGRPRFHLAFPVHDLDAARSFYGSTLGCPEGRSCDEWVDFDLFGHQIVAHLSPDELAPDELSEARANAVDGKAVPTRHFGLVLDVAGWHGLVARLKAAGTPFLIEPYTRFAGEAGEQHTCFVTDPSGNALEFKAFADDAQIFAR